MMIQKSIRLAGTFIVLLGLNLLLHSGCKHTPVIDMTMPPDDTTTVVPIGKPCSPDSVYFSLQILPILVSNCAMDNCHSNNNPEEGVNLTSYSKVMATADIKPGQLKGDLWEAINETDPKKRMPVPPRSPLSTEQLELIRKWIQQGALDKTCDADANGCSTINMSFAQHIMPLLKNVCTGCHSGSSASGNINLSTFEGVSVVAANGRLTGAIKKRPGYTAMPPAGNALSPCNVDKIEAWIAQGIKNN